MSDVTAMIPVLLGSTRVPDKNIILVNGKVLCSYTINACKESEVFDSICLNSEDDIFKTIAEKEGVNFHKRPPEWGGRACLQNTKSRNCNGERCVINEHYLYQFMTAGTHSEYVCQVNATSPLLKSETIRAFVDKLKEGNFDSLFATTELAAESLYQNQPVSFSRKYKQPSNELESIQSICWAIAGWRREKFIEVYKNNDPEEDGPAFAGNMGVFPIDEREALDIDYWSTLDVVEQFLIARENKTARTWEYIDGRSITVE